jgi:hypothetical protein
MSQPEDQIDGKKRSNKMHNYVAASPVTAGKSINQAFKP